MASMQEERSTSVAEEARQGLEQQARETQQKLGGSEATTVITEQIAIPAELSQKSKEVWSWMTLAYYLVSMTSVLHSSKFVDLRILSFLQARRL